MKIEDNKAVFKVKFTRLDDINTFVNIVNKYNIDIDATQGRWNLNAKSVLALYSLNLADEIQIVAYTDDADIIIRLEKDLKRYYI